MGKKFMGYDNASELLTAIGNKIKANKSNTLYAINTGVKNALVVEDRESSGSGTIKFSAKNGVVTVTGTAGSNTSFFSFNFTGISGRFKLNGCPSGGSDNTYSHRIYTADGSLTIAVDRGSGTAEFTLDPNVTYQWTIRIQGNYAIQNSLVFRPMLYQADTDGSTFQTGALPNYDLTRLEAEDRAALAEVVDSGAKNLYLYNESYGFDNCSVDSEGVYTTAGDSLSNLRLQLSLYGDSGVIENLNINPQGKFPTITDTGVYHCIFTHRSGATNLMIGHNGSTYNGRYRQPISNLTPGTTYVISLNLTQVTNASGQFKWKDVMICTLADWKVSQKFVPYDGLEAKPHQINIASESVLNDLPAGIVTGNLQVMIAGIENGQWVTIHTIDLNTASGNKRRRMQVIISSGGLVASRLYYTGAWQQWYYGHNDASKIFERTTSGNETIANILPYGSFQLLVYHTTNKDAFSVSFPRSSLSGNLKLSVIGANGVVLGTIMRSGSTTTYVCTVADGYTLVLFGY